MLYRSIMRYIPYSKYLEAIEVIEATSKDKSTWEKAAPEIAWSLTTAH